MKFAYFVLPHVGGTYTVYKSVRAGLSAYGVDIRWVGVGPEHRLAMEDFRWADELAHGCVVGGYESNEKAQARALVEHIENGGYDGVFVNAACNRVHSNVVRYLGQNIRRIMTVHTITVATYAGAQVLRDHVHSTICVSPRIRDDLLKKCRFPVSHTHTIPNAIDVDPYRSCERSGLTDGNLKLLFLGRIIDSDKGVFWLPQIMKYLNDIPVDLTIAGDGPDLEELKRRCVHMSDRIRFIGRIPSEKVSLILSEYDAFLFPSRFEGLPLSLVEAMASGCVPVASRIKGVTDFVINNGCDGFLFGIGDVRVAADFIRKLALNREMLLTMSTAAQQNVVSRFELESMAEAYYRTVKDVMNTPRNISAPLPFEEWHYPRGLKPGLRTYLPDNIKKYLRMWREKFA